MTKEIIGRYQIQSEIGRGGMATVYLAHDPNFRRNVAIKLVAGNLQSEHMYRERFEREAHLIARIEHPAIVPVYDYGEHENNLYLVMRYMPGGSLAGKIKDAVLTLGDAAQIISQIAPALDAVHAQDIVHRDLKPGNILFDGFGNPAISDFGIAHFTSATSDLTGSAVIGTPAYMSPEQVRSDRDLDGRSDIYALGVILFEMLAGHGPFQSTTPLSIAFKHLTDPIPSIRSFRPDLPAELEAILNKALAKDREMRYSTASELARDLRAVSDSFKEDQAPLPVRPSDGRDAATEVDTGEDSQPAFASSSVPKASSQESIHRPSHPGKPVRQASRRPLQVVAIAGVGLFLFFLCGSLGVFGTWAGLRGLFQAQDPTVPPTVTVTQASNVQNTILFADDFSDPNSGWPAGQNAQAVFGYQPDGYRILVSGTNKAQWVYTDRVYDNASLYVDAAPVMEGANGYYGLLCRIQDDQNFYYFVIQRNGSYTIGKYKDAEFSSFFPEGWRQSSVLDTAGRLQADCTGNLLRLYVNNVMLGEVTDPDFTSGFSGILAATLDEQDFEVRFNNFLITKADQ
ncbi:MAG TPA: serine/threonine-protein kinase [Anaerolineales bacterium]|nr:serine/threonine-protein kinase [Anaerolineales bacterium]